MGQEWVGERCDVVGNGGQWMEVVGWAAWNRLIKDDRSGWVGDVPGG